MDRFIASTNEVRRHETCCRQCAVTLIHLVANDCGGGEGLDNISEEETS